jgi:hypothetical protein
MKQENDFAEKLRILLENQEFRNLINNFQLHEEEDEHDNEIKDIQKTLSQKKEENQKKERQKIIMAKRKINLSKNNLDTNMQDNEENKQKKKANKNNKENKTKKMESNKETREDLNNSLEEQNDINNTEHPYLFFYKDTDNNEKIYTYHRNYNEYYHLRCTDRKCLGTAKYNKINGKIEICKICSIEFENHSYIKEKIIKKN